MPGLVPGIHAFADRPRRQDVDRRDKPGDDESGTRKKPGREPGLQGIRTATGETRNRQSFITGISANAAAVHCRATMRQCAILSAKYTIVLRYSSERFHSRIA